MVAKGDPKNTLQALQLPGAGLRAVHPECANTYQTKLAQSQENNANNGNLLWNSQVGHFSDRDIRSLCSPPGSGDWVKHCFSDRYHYYYNLETGQGTWEEPEGFHHRGDHLCKEEIQVLLLTAFLFLSLLSLLVTSLCWFSVYLCAADLSYLCENNIFSLVGYCQLCYCRI